MLTELLSCWVLFHCSVKNVTFSIHINYLQPLVFFHASHYHSHTTDPMCHSCSTSTSKKTQTSFCNCFISHFFSSEAHSQIISGIVTQFNCFTSIFQRKRSQTACKAVLIDVQQHCTKPMWDPILFSDLVSVKIQPYKLLLDEQNFPQSTSRIFFALQLS